MTIQFSISTISLALSLLGAVSSQAQSKAGTVLWKYDTGSTIRSSPALAPDGTIYVAGASLYAITNIGITASNKWTFSSPPSGSASVGADGTVYFVGSGGGLYAVNPDGTLRWLYQSQSGGGTPAIGLDGTVYFDGYLSLYAVTPFGSLKWQTSVAGTGNYESPVVSSDGTIYAGSWEGVDLYAINPDGSQRWARGLSSAPWDCPAIASDGTLVVSASSLCTFNPEGTNLWCSGTGFAGPPVIASGGTIYVADTGRTLWALTPAGQVLWRAFNSNPQYGAATCAALDAAGTIYYCVSNSLWALNAQGKVLWSVASPVPPPPSGDLANSSPIVGPDGTIYATLASTLYAISSGTNGPTGSPWPMYRQNIRHTGKVEKPALGQPQKRSDNNFQFQMYPQQIGLSYTIESSTNLNTWTSLTSFVATSLPMPVTDLSASNSPSKFYRAYSSQ